MSYGLYIGKNYTATKIAYLAGYGDEPSSHWLEIVPRMQHTAGTMVTVGVTPEADPPGVLSEIPQVPETARQIRVSYSYYRGAPSPLTNGGLNEHGVAVRDIWSPSRPELVAMTPATQTGPSYSDLARFVLDRARTAREGVLIIRDLIAQYGHSTYGGNSHMIADENEAWVVIEFAGDKNLWAAERLGPDSIRASRPGYIGEVSVDSDQTDFLHSDNLVSFAVEQGWYSSGRPFNVNNVYGDQKQRWAGVQWIEDEMLRRARRPEKVGIKDVMWAVRTSRLTGDTAGYGQVVPLVRPATTELRVLWHAPIGAVAAPFTPVFMGTREVTEEFQQHRYLTAEESSRFLDTRKLAKISTVPQGIEATQSAVQVFKRLLYLVMQRPKEFLPEITATWEGFEHQLLERYPSVASATECLVLSGKVDLAVDYLSYFSTVEMQRSLALGQSLAAATEARLRMTQGIVSNPTPSMLDQLW